MKSDISSERYKKLISDHRIIKSMKPSQFIQWATSFYTSAYNEGRNSAYDDIAANKDSIIVPDYIDADIYEEDEVLDMTQLYEILLSVKGIGIKRANKVIDLVDVYFKGKGNKDV